MTRDNVARNRLGARQETVLWLSIAGILAAAIGFSWDPTPVAQVLAAIFIACAGQTSAAIRAEELRGQLRRFYVKQVETGDAGEFDRMSIEELRAYVYGDDEMPPKGPKGPVKH